MRLHKSLLAEREVQLKFTGKTREGMENYTDGHEQLISRATVRWIPLKVLNPTPRFKTRAHFLTNLFTQSHFLLKIWLPGI